MRSFGVVLIEPVIGSGTNLLFARHHIAPRVAQSYLGHTNITITLNYYQDVDESDLCAAGQLLN
jgi:integrase